MNDFKTPWHDIEVMGWLIVGMNHYRIDETKFLYVAMTDSLGHCIVEKGADDRFLWNRLWHKADAYRRELEEIQTENDHGV